MRPPLPGVQKYGIKTVAYVHCLIQKEILREPISKINNGMVTGPLRLLSNMVKIASKPGINMTVLLLNQVMIVEVISAEWELRTIDNFFKKKKKL